MSTLDPNGHPTNGQNRPIMNHGGSNISSTGTQISEVPLLSSSVPSQQLPKGPQLPPQSATNTSNNPSTNSGYAPQQYRYYNDQYYYNQQGSYPYYMYNQQSNYPYNYYPNQNNQSASPQVSQRPIASNSGNLNATGQNLSASQSTGMLPPQMNSGSHAMTGNIAGANLNPTGHLSATGPGGPGGPNSSHGSVHGGSTPGPGSIPAPAPITASAPSGPTAVSNGPGPGPGPDSIPSSSTIGQYQPPGIRPRVTTTMWEDEKTLCYQVDANNVSVVRRADNNMINGTKLLNVAQMTRGRRDGILKLEKVRHVVKIGSMHLKGVWIPFERALAMAQREGIVDLLYPLFVRDIKRVIQTGISPSKSTAYYDGQPPAQPQQQPQAQPQQQAQPPQQTSPQSQQQPMGYHVLESQPPVYGYQQYYPSGQYYPPYNGYQYNNQMYPHYQYQMKPKDEKDEKKE